ncbi:MAG: hypothetical protein GY869_12395 [Planctomycetes bacterium]|nr:hypothetical protein [Planctomycetota bacterium]
MIRGISILLAVLIVLGIGGCVIIDCNDDHEYWDSYEYDDHREVSDHPMSEVIEGFDLYSYYAGINTYAAEIVSYNCKKIALSAPYTEEEFEALYEPTRRSVEQYGVVMYVERDFLNTLLFDPLDEDVIVIFIVQNQKVLDEYLALKELKHQAIEDSRLAEVEEEIAWKFGRLLSYDDETIKRLLSRR